MSPGALRATKSGGVAVCGVAVCGVAACGVAACGVAACGVAACGVAACEVAACVAARSHIEMSVRMTTRKKTRPSLETILMPGGTREGSSERECARACT